MATELQAQRQRRLTFLLIALTAAAALLAWRAYYWQVLQYNEVIVARPDAYVRPAPAPPRGTLFDRNGYPLATDVYIYHVFASPNMMGGEKDRREAAANLAPLLKQPAETILEQIVDRTLRYVPLGETSVQVGEKILASDIVGVGADVEPRRAYPIKDLAKHVLGSTVKRQDRQDKPTRSWWAGYQGVEARYDDLLSGATPECKDDGRARAAHLQVGLREIHVSGAGCDLILTIDWVIQSLVERELKAALTRYGAQGGTIIVLDPKTGAILALANAPLDRADNAAISASYEPGSVFKIITLAAALDSGRFTPDSTYLDTGLIIVGGQPIRNWDKKAYGLVRLPEILAKSLNVGAVYVAVNLGAEIFYKYVDAFGFGKTTDVDLVDEARGTVRHPADGIWSEADLATNAFGQGISVTPLQMIRAVAAIANEGVPMKPYVVAATIAQGQLRHTKPTPLPRVVSVQTAQQMTQMLVTAAEQLPQVHVPGHRLAGKTGTAQIFDPGAGHYEKENTVASYVGYGPASDPHFVVLVKLDKPNPKINWGAEVAAPVFRNIAQQLLLYMEIPSDD